MRFLWNLAIISIFSLSFMPQSQAADFSSPYLPELKSITIDSVDESENWSYGPKITATFTIRIHRNAVKSFWLNFASSNAVSNPLAQPCKGSVLVYSSSIENLSSISDADWRIETLRAQMILSGGLIRTACVGTYTLTQIDIYDVANRQLQIFPTYQASLFWEALGESSPYLPCKTTWVGAPAWSRTKCNQTLNWDSYKFDITQASLSEPKLTKAEIELKAKQEADAKAAAELKAKQEAEAKAAAELKAKQEAEAKAAAELKAKQEAEAKVAADLKAKQEAEMKAAAELKAKAAAEKAAAELKAKQEADAKAAAELKAKQEADTKASADKAALAKAQSELAAANAALADAQKVNREQAVRITSFEEQFKVLSESVATVQNQLSQLNSKLVAALTGLNTANAKIKKICAAKPKPKGC